MATRDGYVTCPDGVRLFFHAVGDGPGMAIVPNGIHLVEDFARLAEDRHTLVFYDVRNRGRSDAIAPDAAGEDGTSRSGILQDAEDLHAVVRHFALERTGERGGGRAGERVDLIGHSFAGLLVVLHAMTYPAEVGRIIQIGAISPNPDTQYPAHLTCVDDTFRGVMAALAELRQERDRHDPEEFCRRTWALLRPLYVTDPADAGRITWSRCDLAHERGAMKYFMERTLPSIRQLALTVEQIARVKAPVLTVHGRKDRSAPYGSGREWASSLPDARLLTIDDGGHAPWIEAPELLFGALETFLAGGWPSDAQRVTALDCDSRDSSDSSDSCGSGDSPARVSPSRDA